VAGRSALTLLRDSFAGGSCYIFARDENSISCWRSCEEKKEKALGVLFLPQSSARTKCAGNFIVDAAVVFSVSQSYGIFNFTSHR
jgi:hypothetical protein